MPWNYPCTLLKALNEDARPPDHAITCLGKVDSHDTWDSRPFQDTWWRKIAILLCRTDELQEERRKQQSTAATLLCWISISVVLMPCKVKSFYVVRSALLLCLSFMALFLILATCMRLHCKNKILTSDTYPRQHDDHTTRNVDLYQVINRFSVEV